MKHSIEVTGYILLLFVSLALALSSFTTATPPPVPASLGVPLVGQVGTCWCWAACVEMITTYMHSKNVMVPIIPQCDEVHRGFPSWNILCPMVPPVPSQYDAFGVPFSTDLALGYSFKLYSGADSNYNGAIPYDSLCAEFAAGRPTIFQWQWHGISVQTVNYAPGQHFLVAEGAPSSKYGGSSQWVAINDPMPYILGHHRVITYREFANVDAMQAQPGLHPGDSNKAGVQWKGPMVRSFNPDFVFCNHLADMIGITYSDTLTIGKGAH